MVKKTPSENYQNGNFRFWIASQGIKFDELQSTSVLIIPQFFFFFLFKHISHTLIHIVCPKST